MPIKVVQYNVIRHIFLIIIVRGIEQPKGGYKLVMNEVYKIDLNWAKIFFEQKPYPKLQTPLKSINR